MATEDVLERYARMLRDQNWSDLARQQVMDEMAAELRLLQKDRERLDWIFADPFAVLNVKGAYNYEEVEDRGQLDAARASAAAGGEG